MSDINSLPVELLICIFRWIPVRSVLKFRRLCKAANETLLTTQFALLNLELPTIRHPHKSNTHQSNIYLWLKLPENYQAAFADKYMAKIEAVDAYNATAGPFPTSIQQLKHLKSVYLARAGFTGRIPDGLGGLSNLTRLFLDSNRLEGAIPTSFNNLVALEALMLSHNRFTGEFPDLSSMNSLTRLDITHNQFTGPIPTRFGRPSLLHELKVGRNQFSSIPPTISNLTNVSYLHIGYNPISGPIPKELWNLSNLVVLELCHCGLTGSLAGVGALSCLEELDACFNDFTGGIPPNEIPQLSQLQLLHLIGNARLQRQLWDFEGLNSFQGMCMDEAVFSTCTIRGISAHRSCNAYHWDDLDCCDSD
ncbi:hypothetical protein HDU81_009546 [Chytriomyces hyalinus]|nr:hypothetical protein HDU81_009546 [Chytriomyces hyalinus]